MTGRRFLEVRFDVTGLDHAMIDALAGEVLAQAERSDGWPTDGHPSVEVKSDVVEWTQAEWFEHESVVLEAAYGPDPQLVGVVDSTEDEYGDLLTDAAAIIGVDTDDQSAWRRFREAAEDATATTMGAWLVELAASFEARSRAVAS